MHILQPCQDGWLSLLEQKRKISPGRCRSAPPFLIVMSPGGGAGHFRDPTRPMSSDITPNDTSTFTLFISFIFTFALTSHYYPDCICVCACSQAHTYSLCSCLIMPLLSLHCLMGFNSWCLEQMRAFVRASWCAFRAIKTLPLLSIRKAFVLFLFA